MVRKVAALRIFIWGFVLLLGAISFVSAVEETVVCVFENSDEVQRCYVPEPDTWEGLECEGVGYCIVSIEGPGEFDIHWKSTCTASSGAEVIIDGKDDLIIFDCETGRARKNEGFKESSWRCDDGIEDNDGQDICKTKGAWYREAIDFCSVHCTEELEEEAPEESSEETLSVGPGDPLLCVSSYETYNKCSFYDINDYLEGMVVEVQQNYFCLGCSTENKCYLLGYRKSGEYCSDSLEFIRQLPEDLTCENNFECQSNFCIAGQCVDSTLMQRIISWFRKVFG